jgi:glycosyltransferase involved in cell wall biosynthesis
MIRILRPTRAAALISARVFDDLFARNLASEVDVKPVELLPWLDEALGPVDASTPLGEAARLFTAATEGFDFFCPGYECISLTPLFLSLRNRSRSRIRLLFIAHAPGAYLLEWALIRPLLTPGDLIIAPSASAASLIDFLCPSLNTNVRVIPHPLHPLPSEANGARERIVSLGRITPTKLLHRQIEAMAILRRRGVKLRMDIAGPLNVAPSSTPRVYARALSAKIRRLCLEDDVKLVGEIRGESEKARFLSRARLLLNLSVTIEESFGKSVVEALGLGVPVLATHWDGLPETVGDGGQLLQVSVAGVGVDVAAEQIADAIEQMLAAPPAPEACREQAGRFSPARVSPLYRMALKEAMDAHALSSYAGDSVDERDQGAAPPNGLLAHAAPLAHFSWSELFDFHAEDSVRLRRLFVGENPQGLSNADRLRSLLLAGTRAAVERFLGGLNCAELATPMGADIEPPVFDGPFIARIAGAAGSSAIPRSRLACLSELAAANETDQLWKRLTEMRREGFQPYGFDYLLAEAERQRGNFLRAFQLCINIDDPHLRGELAAYRWQQLARIAREWDRPAFALPWLREWLEEFPDSPDSGAVWRDRCLNSLLAGDDFLAEAREAFAHAKELSAPSTLLNKIEVSLASQPQSRKNA